MFTSALIVDPDPGSIAFYESVLASRAERIDYAIDGRDALFKLLAHPPELLVVEARLPLLNGCDLCAIVRRDPYAPLVSAIVTALTDAVIEQRVHACGADVILAKPLDAVRFTQAIDALYSAAAMARARSRRIRRDARATREQARIIHRESRALWRKPPS
jgi:DNA-binding response OmpR family regulator